MRHFLARIRSTACVCGLLLAGAASAPAAAPTGSAGEIIHHFNMEKIPAEGPWFSLTYRSADALAPGSLPARYQGVPHVAGSAIYTVQTPEAFSAMHVLQTDEIWHFYGGSPLEVLLLYPDGHGETLVLGPDVLNGQHAQLVVPRGVWQGSRPIGKAPGTYTFFGNTLGPGFEYADFAIGYRDELQKKYPKFAALIGELTREEFATRPKNDAAKLGNADAAGAMPGKVFASTEAPLLSAGAGINLRELIGRTGVAKTDAYSIALFTLDAGKGSPTSYNQVSEEVFLVMSGEGEVTLGHQTTKVATGSTTVIPARVRHSIRAAPGQVLTFYAISVPAYSHEDYVLSPEN